jgi:hypothetical protein
VIYDSATMHEPYALRVSMMWLLCYNLKQKKWKRISEESFKSAARITMWNWID